MRITGSDGRHASRFTNLSGLLDLAIGGPISGTGKRVLQSFNDVVPILAGRSPRQHNDDSAFFVGEHLWRPGDSLIKLLKTTTGTGKLTSHPKDEL
jgi:hypothetical protein